jgi:hypothetical protein
VKAAVLTRDGQGRPPGSQGWLTGMSKAIGLILTITGLMLGWYFVQNIMLPGPAPLPSFVIAAIRADDDLGGRALHTQAFEEETPSGIAPMIKRIAALLAMMAGLAVVLARRRPSLPPARNSRTGWSSALPSSCWRSSSGYYVVWSVDAGAAHTR